MSNTKDTPMDYKQFEYEVTCDGKVFSYTKWRGIQKRELNQTLNSDGYPSVRMIVNGVRKRLAVHRLVANKFLGPKPPGKQIRHLDGNKLNCHKNNLSYGTAQENANDREAHGRTSRGLSHSQVIKQALHGL